MTSMPSENAGEKRSSPPENDHFLTDLHALLKEQKRQGEILDALEKLLPAMHKAASMLSNPAAAFREHVKPWKRSGA